MAVLLIADYDHNNLSEQTSRCLSAALKMASEVDILVVGKNIGTIAQEAAHLSNVRKVIAMESDSLEHQLAEPLAKAIMSLSDDYDYLVASTSTVGKSTMPRVAALLDVMQISEIIAVVEPNIFKRPIYAGNAVQVVESNEAKKVITVRMAAFDTAQKVDTPCVIENIVFEGEAKSLSKFIKNDLSVSDLPELGSARIVISGGRALGSSDNFKHIILPIADKLGAAVGASRAAVDAGYAPNDWQVGQTGKVVAPDLYIACGISGAIQHMAGMKDSKIIVAINKDAEAPIFQIADYGIVGDLFEILPDLLRRLD